jgi:uncharacterized membrane protein
MEKLTRFTALILFAFYSVLAFADTSSGPGRMSESGMMDGGMMGSGMMIVCMLVGLLVLTLLVLGILALVKFLRRRKS